ncbi:MAG: hypothetical protein WA364_21135 [Candidatus Nitrosopolaris sp.]
MFYHLITSINEPHEGIPVADDEQLRNDFEIKVQSTTVLEEKILIQKPNKTY